MIPMTAKTMAAASARGEAAPAPSLTRAIVVSGPPGSGIGRLARRVVRTLPAGEATLVQARRAIVVDDDVDHVLRAVARRAEPGKTAAVALRLATPARRARLWSFVRQLDVTHLLVELSGVDATARERLDRLAIGPSEKAALRDEMQRRLGGWQLIGPDEPTLGPVLRLRADLPLAERARRVVERWREIAAAGTTGGDDAGRREPR